MNPEDKTRFKDLVQGVEPLPPGPRLVPTSPPSEPAVVVRPRASRSIELQEADGIWFAHASDASPRQALDLAKLPPDRQYRRLDLHRMSAARASVALDTAVRQA